MLTPSLAPVRARLTVALVFAASGAVFGSSAPRISEVKVALGLSTGALAAVSTGGYTGFLVGPTAIGGVAEFAGLVAALWMLPALAMMAALLTRCAHGSGRTAGLKPPDQSALGNSHPTPGAQPFERAARADW